MPVLALLACLGSLLAKAADPEVDPHELPRIPPTQARKALETFQVKSGFHLDQVAAEPLVLDPIALSFDEQGRLYVVEMRDYSERRPERLGCIRLLEDTDGDGHFDRSTVFAKDLPWPTAVICWNGGVFVAATPDIYYFKDTTGDGVADIREVIFTGFGGDYAPYATNKLNVQAMLNSFNWSLDNRIHGATSFNGGQVRRVDSPFVRSWLQRFGTAGSGGSSGRGNKTAGPSGAELSPAPLNLRGRDFSFDPRRLDLRPESGGGQYGLSFDNQGRKYVCSNSSHLQALLYEDRYAARNSAFAMPRALAEIAVDGGAAAVYRISPDEPWRVIRTRWRVSGVVPGLIEGGGRPSGYFTGATGLTIYRGNAFPAEMVGDAFVADCGSNLIHRKKIRANGIDLVGERPPDERQTEFVASRDNWFRPVQMANGPDGALYVCDMYREVIEHPWSLPPTLKKHLDLNSGNDRGRLYRILPDHFRQPNLPRLGRAATAELVRTLEHDNGWHRDTAARLLCERNDRSAIPALSRLATGSRNELGRLHALSVLASLEALTEPHALKALADGSAVVRRQAVRLCEPFLHTGSPQIIARVAGLASDPDMNVRLQVAFSLGEATGPSRLQGLQRLLTHKTAGSAGEHGEHAGAAGSCDLDRPLIRAAVLNSLADQAGELLTVESADALYQACPATPAREFFSLLVESLGARNPQEAKRALAFVVGLAGPVLAGGDPARAVEALALATALGDGVRKRGSSLADVDDGRQLQSLFAFARRIASDTGAPEELRLAAVRFLGHDPDDRLTLPVLFSRLAADPPAPLEKPELQKAALAALARMPATNVGEGFIARWPRLTPELRKSALAALLIRPERVRLLLQALGAGQIARTELDAAQQDFLKHHKDASLRAEAERWLSGPAVARRQQVVEQFQSALQLTGQPDHGRQLFVERCATCHQLGGLGQRLGPDLVSVKGGGKDKMLVNILDPNREVNSNYLSYLIETRSGETFSGIITSETATSLTLRQAGGLEITVLRSNLLTVQSQDKSLMPEGLEAGLTPQDLADLMEFVVGDHR